MRSMILEYVLLGAVAVVALVAIGFAFYVLQRLKKLENETARRPRDVEPQ